MAEELTSGTATPDSAPAGTADESLLAGGTDGGQPPADGAPEAKPADGQGAATDDNTKDEALLNPDGGEEQPKAEEDPVPENGEYSFNLPEGFTLEGEMKTEVDTLFKECGIGSKRAQKLVDYFTERQLQDKERMLSDLSAKRKAWRAEVRQSPTFAQDRAMALKGMRAVVQTPEEKALFTDSWLSDHPAVFGIFAKVGRLLGEDQPLQNGSSSGEEDNINLRRFPIK